jgi:hypothetical protein
MTTKSHETLMWVLATVAFVAAGWWIAILGMWIWLLWTRW